MLSIVPLMNGGGLFETGAGIVPSIQQFEKENHLRWDSLGEFALGTPEHSDVCDNESARILGRTIDSATTQYLLNKKAPSAVPANTTTRARTSTWPCTGRRPCGPDRRPRPRGRFGRSPRAGRCRGDDQFGTDRLPGFARRHRRLLPSAGRARRPRDETERHLQRHHRWSDRRPGRLMGNAPTDNDSGRPLGLVSATAIVIATIIGSGIFTTTGQVARASSRSSTSTRSGSSARSSRSTGR